MAASASRRRRRPTSTRPTTGSPGTRAPGQPTLRPRLTKSAAFVRLHAAAQRAGIPLPDTLARKHSAGIEQLMLEMSSEYLDRHRLEDLLALLE